MDESMETFVPLTFRRRGARLMVDWQAQRQLMASFEESV